MTIDAVDAIFLKQALAQAQKSYNEGGLPIGAVMVEDGVEIGAGHNRRVQDGDPDGARRDGLLSPRRPPRRLPRRSRSTRRSARA